MSIRVDIPRKITRAGLQVQPNRGIVELTLAWLGQDRRLSKDYEGKVNHAANFIRLSMMKRTVSRLTNHS